MSLLKDLGNKAISTAKAVGEKSSDAVGIGKLKMKITHLEGDIKKLKVDIGEAVYNAYANGLESPTEQVIALCNSINDKVVEINNIKYAIEEVKND